MEITLDTVGGEFDVAMAVYEDSSFTIVAGSDYTVQVPDHIHLGLMLTDGDNFLLQAKRCWVTPDANATNVVQYDIIQDGCPNEDVSLFVLYYSALSLRFLRNFRRLISKKTTKPEKLSLRFFVFHKASGTVNEKSKIATWFQ